MKILFLTDSLALPRSDEKNPVRYEDTYLFLLREKYSHITMIDSAIGGAAISDLYKQVFYYKTISPDIVFIQCGIVDCAPRAWRSLGRKILSKSGLKIPKITRFVRKYRGLKITSPKKFDWIASKIRNEFGSCEVYAIGILPASSEYEKQLPGISRSVERYNRILSKHFNFIDNTNFDESAIMEDHHHLNAKGHQIIFHKISKLIDEHESH